MSKLNLLGSDHADSERTFFRNSRITLVVGFGGLLLIMALAGIDALLVLRQFRRSDEEIRQRYLSQNHVLNDIRSDVYVSGTYIRDSFSIRTRRGRKCTGLALRASEGTWSLRSNSTAAKRRFPRRSSIIQRFRPRS